METAIQQLEQLYEEMGPSLLAYFRRQRGLMGCAEDLLQDTFVCALHGIDRLCASASLRAYLFGIARHVGLAALQRLGPPPGPVAAVDDYTSSVGDPRLETMRAAITELPADLRETLLLKLRHELSYSEIAEVLAVPIGTVRSRLHHAVRHLKEKLNPDATSSHPSLEPSP